MAHIENISASEAMNKLKAGNEKYLNSKTSSGDVSIEKRSYSCENGQQPYAIIIGCSDSRVIPESIFSAGIGDLFVIRVAGNVIDDHQLGSVEYAAEHLGCKLVVVLGHSHCGAVGAAINDNPDGYVKSITDEIKRAIGSEKDDIKACVLNIHQSVNAIKDGMKKLIEAEDGLKVIGAIYHIEDGKVEFDV